MVDSEFDFDKASKSKKSIDRYPKCVLRIECLREVELGDVLALGGEGGTETARTGKGGVEGEVCASIAPFAWYDANGEKF